MFQGGVVSSSTIRGLCRQRSTIVATYKSVLASDQPSVSISAVQRHGKGKGSRSNHSLCSVHHESTAITRMNASSVAKYNSTWFFNNTVPLSSFHKSKQQLMMQTIRTFRNVGHYHDVADDTLHSIQDAVEDYFEEHYNVDDDSMAEEDIPEVNYASGVLTIYLPPHGTWVINKQTPNEQIWWSSPISGPRRYEYDEKQQMWVYSRVADDGGADDVGDVSYGEEDTLGGILNKEFEELFGQGLGL